MNNVLLDSESWSTWKRASTYWSSYVFRQACNTLSLIDSGANGIPYTWSNRRGILSHTKAKLDHALGNYSWREL